jgi:PTS system N-acetylgalactosamine-specific IIA component
VTVRAVLAGHGGVAQGLVSAVEAIAGRGAAFAPLSNAGLGADALVAALRTAVEAHAVDVIFTDLPAGSATLAARRLQRERPALRVVAGANLATLLEFAMRPDIDADELVAKGRAALVAWPAAGPR